MDSLYLLIGAVGGLIAGGVAVWLIIKSMARSRAKTIVEEAQLEADMLKKNKLLKLLIKDCTLQDKELKYTVRAPFDKFIQCNNPTQWFKDPTQDLDTYAKIADEVKMVKQQVLLTC